MSIRRIATVFLFAPGAYRNPQIGGEPHPDVKWTKSGSPLEEGANLTLETKKNEHTILCIPTASRADCGEYRVR